MRRIRALGLQARLFARLWPPPAPVAAPRCSGSSDARIGWAAMPPNHAGAGWRLATRGWPPQWSSTAGPGDPCDPAMQVDAGRAVSTTSTTRTPTISETRAPVFVQQAQQQMVALRSPSVPGCPSTAIISGGSGDPAAAARSVSSARPLRARRPAAPSSRRPANFRNALKAVSRGFDCAPVVPLVFQVGQELQDQLRRDVLSCMVIGGLPNWAAYPRNKGHRVAVAGHGTRAECALLRPGTR